MSLHAVVVHLFSLPYGCAAVYLCILQLIDFLVVSRFCYYKQSCYELFIRLLWSRHKSLVEWGPRMDGVSAS